MSKQRLPFFVFILALIITSCENPECDDTAVCLPSIASSWHLTEVLMDPGDGSGTFQSVDSNRILTIYADDNFLSSGSLCNLGLNNEEEIAGRFNREEAQLEFLNCYDNTSAEMLFLPIQNTGDELIISFPCDEPCQWKFRRIIID